jgi:hypothetical protein
LGAEMMSISAGGPKGTRTLGQCASFGSTKKKGYQFFEMNFVVFLVSLLTRKITVVGFKSKWNPKKDITFTLEVYGG